MKLLLIVFCAALFIAVDGKRFEYKCIRLDVNGTVTVTAKNTKTNETDKHAVDLSQVKTDTKGNCSMETPVKMTVTFDNVGSWQLVFSKADSKVKLDQSVTFDPASLFNFTSLNGSVTVSNTQPLALSSSNASFQCDAQLPIPFTAQEKGDYSFAVSQNITFIQVQAFDLPNGTFSPAEHCDADKPTVAPTTEPTTEPTTVPATTPPVPSVKPVKAEMFVVNDAKGAVCFRLQAGLQFAVQYETTDKTMVFSKVMAIPGSANVTGTCASGSGNTATMTITNANYTLAITETRTKGMADSTFNLTVVLDPTNFPKAAKANQSVSFEMTKTFEPSSAATFYKCDSLQVLSFENSSTTLYTNDVQLQAFDLSNGSFSGNGVRCQWDPTPSPLPPGDNTYTVQEGNITCIVLKGKISFSNFTYAVKNVMATAGPINVPAMNESTKNVKFSGSCKLENGTAQQLVITFNTNWTLTLTFAKSSAKDSSMLAATADEFSVRDIELVYYQIPKFFPNATNQYMMVVASQTNITSDFMEGSTNGGSYKCDAQQTQMLNNSIEFETASLQYKAFNNDNTTAFNDDVTECSADDESNSIVPIAVGAALAGLVVIVLVAYLIGRRRSRRQGYESV